MPSFRAGGLDLHYRDEGSGLPFVFQHGLGGEVSQPFGLYVPPPGVRLIGFDGRGHGASPLGEESGLTLATFADDLLALLDHLRIGRAVVGGISMGAAVALNFALRHPDRLLGLVLSRPAWLDEPFPQNTRIFPRIAALIRDHGAAEGLERHLRSAEHREMLAASPDCAQSLINHLLSPRAEDAVARLERIPRDAPCRDRAAWASIAVPTLVIGNRIDPIHPFAFAVETARLIPGAELVEVTPKSTSVERHQQDVQAALDRFLARVSPAEAPR